MTDSHKLAISMGSKESNARTEIAIRVVGTSIVGVAILSSLVITAAYFDPKYEMGDAARLVFTSVLPLLGTWVGTVLAYYFSKDNFEAANKSVEHLVKVATDEKLKTYPVVDEMIKILANNAIQFTEERGPEHVTIAEMRGMFLNKVSRLPVIDDARRAQCVIHESVLSKFIEQTSLELGKQNPPQHFDAENTSLKQLMDHPVLGKLISESLAFVSEDATLADAKGAMENVPGCADVFITATGRREEPTLGWITDKRILRKARA